MMPKSPIEISYALLEREMKLKAKWFTEIKKDVLRGKTIVKKITTPIS